MGLLIAAISYNHPNYVEVYNEDTLALLPLPTRLQRYHQNWFIPAIEIFEFHWNDFVVGLLLESHMKPRGFCTTIVVPSLKEKI